MLNILIFLDIAICYLPYELAGMFIWSKLTFYVTIPASVITGLNIVATTKLQIWSHKNNEQIS